MDYSKILIDLYTTHIAQHTTVDDVTFLETITRYDQLRDHFNGFVVYHLNNNMPQTEFVYAMIIPILNNDIFIDKSRGSAVSHQLKCTTSFIAALRELHKINVSHES